MGLRQIRIDRHVEARRSPFDTAQHQMLHGIEADCSTRDGVAHRGSDLIGAEYLDQVGKTIWYNGFPTIKAKTRYVVEQELGGVMIWSLDYDVKGEKSLLSAIDEAMNSKPAASPAVK